jgi:hypothetical protein
MDYRDVKMTSEGYTDLYDFKVGDLFIEDIYPDVYQILKITKKGVYKTWNMTDNISCDFFYNKNHPAYAPRLIKAELK